MDDFVSSSAPQLPSSAGPQLSSSAARQFSSSPAPQPTSSSGLSAFQVREILLVSSLYESFIMAEDGHLAELLLTRFVDLNLSQLPTLTHVSSGAEALELLRRGQRYDLVVTSLQSGDVGVKEIADAIRRYELEVPLVVLAHDRAALRDFVARHDMTGIDEIFLWQGDPRLFFAIVKSIEDRRNVAQDTAAGVQAFIVVEDNVRYYSSFLPNIYAEVMKHAQAVTSEGLNLTQKLTLTRARPKILLATTFEQAWADFERYADDVLGVISDIEFPRDGKLSATAGIDLAHRIRELRPDVALTLQSSFPENERLAESVGARFLLKGSPVMLHQLREQLSEHFAFGDFVFRMPDGREVGRAHDVRSLIDALQSAPPESIARHAATNHFSTWLRARAEFDLARELRPRTISDFESIEHMRRDVIASIERHRRNRARSTVADFETAEYRDGGIARIGGGSLGGKARGLAFATRLLAQHPELEDKFKGITITVPTAVVLATDVFDEFLESNGLRDVALRSENDVDIERAFAAGNFPERPREALRSFLARARHPIVVRSSSRLEDSPSLPYAGVFDTYMLPNDASNDDERLDQLLSAIRKVYASAFSTAARTFIRGTTFRLEEEQMAVVIQEMIGSPHGGRFYPDFAGVARSHNFYPVAPLTMEEGIVAVALGLGLTVVDGQPCVRFSPEHPKHIVEFSNTKDMLTNSQREFWAVRLGDARAQAWTPKSALERCPLDVAEKDGTLAAVASTYSAQNDAIYDGMGRDGLRLVSFAPILKHGVFPLSDIIRELLALGMQGTSSPVEIEFAVDLTAKPPVFGLVQLRPLAGAGYVEDIDIDGIDDSELICRTNAVLGNGTVDGVRDLVIVDPRTFVRGRGADAARAVARFNAELAARGDPYILLGAGRWGSADSWLGIPVTWPDISGARAIVEVAFRDFKVMPSQGTHFFQNIVSGNVGYFTLNRGDEGFVDWDWLDGQPNSAEDRGVRHVRLAAPVTVLMNGRTRHGVIRKPGV